MTAVETFRSIVEKGMGFAGDGDMLQRELSRRHGGKTLVLRQQEAHYALRHLCEMAEERDRLHAALSLIGAVGAPIHLTAAGMADIARNALRGDSR